MGKNTIAKPIAILIKNKPTKNTLITKFLNLSLLV